MLTLKYIDKFSDPELNRKANILKKIIWSVLAIMTLSLAISTLLLPENIIRYSVILFILWAASIVLLFFAKKGHTYVSASVYIIFLLIMIFGFSWTGGGIKGHGIKLLPIVVLFAGLTLGRREIWLFGIIAVLGASGLVLADYFNLILVKQPLGNSLGTYLLFTSTGIFLLCYLENLSVEELRKALNESQKELLLRKKSEELLKIKNEKLTEIAFLQSHIVRKPVAHVLGLISLLKLYDPNNLSDSELIPCLEVAAQELDAVIHEIVRNTHEVESLVKTVGESSL
ncbi:MAG: sensor protein [Daejeonella sp.]|nr:sensor protein [Daejeonella sp.]